MLNHLFDNISSYDGNVLLAAIVSLLLVILFVLLLHIYAKWFLAQARRRRSSSRSSMSVSHVLLPGAHRFHHFHSFTFDTDTNNHTVNVDNIDTTAISSSPSKGLEASLIASIPLFVYSSSSEYKQGLECVICLSALEDSDVGRSLPKCGHGFHVDCIDMWLHSHSNCPICRAPVLGEKKLDSVVNTNNNNESVASIEAAASSVELLEIVVDGETRVARVSDASNCDHEVGINDSSSASVSASVASSSSSSLLGSSLKRMFSRNRSDQCKVFPSSNAT